VRRVVLVMVTVAVAAVGVGYLVLERAHRRELAGARAEAEARLAAVRGAAVMGERALAEDLVRALAAAVAPAAASGETERLQEVAAELVRGRRVAWMVVLAPDGTAVAASDLRYRGRRPDEAWVESALRAGRPVVVGVETGGGPFIAAAPVVAGGRRVGTVVVRVEPAGTG